MPISLRRNRQTVIISLFGRVRVNGPLTKAIFYESESPTWFGGQSLKSYEDSIFAPSTFFAAIFTLRAGARALQSLINAYFTGFLRHFIAVQMRCKVTRFSTSTLHLGRGVVGRSFRRPSLEMPGANRWAKARYRIVARNIVSGVWCIRSHEHRCTSLQMGRLGHRSEPYA